MIKAAEYTRRVNHNTQVLQDVIDDSGNITDTLSMLYTFDNEPGDLHFTLLFPKWADIIPAAFMGHLAISGENNGADGYRLCSKNQNYIETEYKIATIRSSLIGVGTKGGLSISYPGQTTKATGITSAVSAPYSIHSDSNLQTKNRETYLCISDVDGDCYDFIDFFKLSGEKALAALAESDKKKRTISLAKFLSGGVPVESIAGKLGWEIFVSMIKKDKHPDPYQRSYFKEQYVRLIEATCDYPDAKWINTLE